MVCQNGGDPGSGDEPKAMYHFISGYTAKAGVFRSGVAKSPDPKKDSKTDPDGFGDMIFPSINHYVYIYIPYIYIYNICIYTHIYIYYVHFLEVPSRFSCAEGTI